MLRYSSLPSHRRAQFDYPRLQFITCLLEFARPEYKFKISHARASAHNEILQSREIVPPISRFYIQGILLFENHRILEGSFYFSRYIFIIFTPGPLLLPLNLFFARDIIVNFIYFGPRNFLNTRRIRMIFARFYNIYKGYAVATLD